MLRITGWKTHHVHLALVESDVVYSNLDPCQKPLKNRIVLREQGKRRNEKKKKKKKRERKKR